MFLMLQSTFDFVIKIDYSIVVVVIVSKIE